MRKPITFPRCEGVYSRQAHCDIPRGLYEREHGRDGFFGPASHLLHAHKPTDWIGWDGPLRPRALDLNRLPAGEGCPWKAHPVLGNGDLQLRWWRAPAGKMRHLVRNGDGDELLFVHAGAGDLFCDYGHLAFRAGDYLLLPRGTAWRIEAPAPCDLLLVEITDDHLELPDRSMVGQHAPFDLAALESPHIDEAFRAQQGEVETQVRVKRRGQLTTITFPFNPLDAVGWHGECAPVRLNWRDVREIVSDRYHLPPPAHATFVSKGVVLCTFAPRPLETDPAVLKLPFFHSNDEYDEILFYHQGTFMSRDDIGPGMLTLHPSGFAHGPHPKAFEAAEKGARRATEEVAVMLDTRRPVDLAPLPEGVENPGYVNSWRPRR